MGNSLIWLTNAITNHLHYLLILYLWSAYWLKFICNPKINTWGFAAAILGHIHAQGSEKLVLSKLALSLLRSSGTALPSCFSWTTEPVTGWRQQGAAQCGPRTRLCSQLFRIGVPTPPPLVGQSQVSHWTLLNLVSSFVQKANIRMSCLRT